MSGNGEPGRERLEKLVQRGGHSAHVPDAGEPAHHRVELEELLAHLSGFHACDAAGQYVQHVQARAANEKLRGAPVLPGNVQHLRLDLGEILDSPEHWVYLVRLHAEHTHEGEPDLAPALLHGPEFRELFGELMREEIAERLGEPGR